MVDSLLMIKAEEIHKRIEEGKPVEYENVIIYGDLDLHNLDLPLNRTSEDRRIDNQDRYSVIKGNVFFEPLRLSGWWILTAPYSLRRPNFSDSFFQEDAGFPPAQFHGEANFSRAHFTTEATSPEPGFNDGDFGRREFHRSFHLSNARCTPCGSPTPSSKRTPASIKDLNYNRIVVRWNNPSANIALQRLSHLTLIKNFRNLEQFEDEDDCYYQYRKDEACPDHEGISQNHHRLAWLSLRLWSPPSHRDPQPVWINPLHSDLLGAHALQPSASASPGSSISINRCLLLQQHVVSGRPPRTSAH